jgi:predicted nucleic acid-binding protein
MIYIDTNIFVYPNTGVGPSSKASISIIEKLTNNELEAGTSILTWDELNYVLRKILGAEKANEATRDFLSTPNLIFFEANEKTLNKAQSLMERYPLKPRDALHAATAILNNCTEIVSDDSDFDKIKELKRRRI